MSRLIYEYMEFSIIEDAINNPLRITHALLISRYEHKIDLYTHKNVVPLS